LAETADRLGFSHIATGHHARIVGGPLGRKYLAAASDQRKDQSYFLYRVPVRLLARSVFPVGEMRKSDVRTIAAEAGVEGTFSRESQDVCFLGGGDLRVFLDRHIESRKGEVMDETGRVLGRHGGIFRYTIGQRRGLGIAGGEPLFVKRIDAAKNRIILAPAEELFYRTVHCTGIRLRGRSITLPLKAKIRYRHPAADVEAVEKRGGRLDVTFTRPQRAPTPGQSLVLYRDELVMGGGVIECSDEEPP
jgi:tRNA-specific 2-thiouridylase